MKDNALDFPKKESVASSQKTKIKNQFNTDVFGSSKPLLSSDELESGGTSGNFIFLCSVNTFTVIIIIIIDYTVIIITIYDYGG